MENKKTLIIVSILLVALIGGASFLYAKLGDNLKPDNLLIQNESAQGNKQETPEVNNGPDTETPGFSGSVEDTDSPANSSDSSTAPGENNASSDENSPFTAPDFTVYDRDGNTVRLSDFLGKPVVLNFWASWCGPCKMEMPAFEEMYKEYGKDIHFIMVNLTDGSRETVEIATAFLNTNEYTFPVYYDKDSDAALIYQVYGIPVTYFINAEGHLIAQGSSALDVETIKRGIELIAE